MDPDRTSIRSAGAGAADLVPHPGQPVQIGKYRVLGRVGAGAFGAVYKCQDPALDRVVAVKVLLAADHAGPEAVERFRREARTAARLSHPHVVPVFDAGVDDGRPYLVLEYVEGQPLDRLIGGPRLTVEVTLRVIYHLAQALQAAHDQGIVHRDVKPANVLIDPAGRPKLTDFGLARFSADAAKLSQTGDLLGTPRYMSPEQALLPPDEVDHRTDVYSLGAVLYEMLTGVPAADGPTALAVLRRVTDEEPTPVRSLNPDVPEEVAAICRRMLAKDRDARVPTAGAVADAIQGYILGKLFGTPEVELLAGLPPMLPPGPARPRSKRAWATGAVAAGVLVLVGFGVARVVAPPAGTVVVETPAAAVDPARVAVRAGADLARLAAVADDRTYRDKLGELLDDVNAAVRQHPDDTGLRLARGRLLRRVGEYLPAAADLDRAGADPAVPLERALARYEWEVIYLGSLSEAVLRPLPSAELRADLTRLTASADESVKYVGRVGLAVGWGSAVEVAAALAGRPASPSADLRADLALMEADALARAAATAHDGIAGVEPDKKADLRAGRDKLDAGSAQAVRRGLEADPHHPGLLFLKANGWPRRVEWEAADGDDRDGVARRHRAGFEAAYQRFRTAAPRVGLEAAAGRAVLLTNYGRNEPALDQLTEAAGRLPVPPAVAALRAWLQLYSPPDGELSAAFAGQVLGQLAPAFDPPPADFAPYLCRALAVAATGRWDDARRDLLAGKRAFAGPEWPPPGPHADWCQAAADSPARFLDATVGVMWAMPTPTDLRLRLQEDLLKRLTGPDPGPRDGLPDDEVRSLTGWGHLRMAEFWAEKDDRANVLKHARAALELRVPDLTPAKLRETAVKAWNTDEEFVKLYAEFEKP